VDALPPGQRARWEAALRDGRLRRVGGDDASWILALPDYGRAPRHLDAVASWVPRAHTLDGLPRTPLALPEPAGLLELRDVQPFVFAPEATRLLTVELENASGVAWPGYDVQPEGLVRARYEFHDLGDAVAASGLAALAEDVPARARIALALPIRSPAAEGRYRLRIELVQQVGHEERVLPVSALWLEAEVRSLKRRPARQARG
jgi:hypothetical protein